MSGELVCEIFCDDVGTADPAAALAQSWARLSFTEAAGPASGGVTVEIGVPTAVAAVAATARAWRRDGTAEQDAQIILSWLRGNALCDRFGVDTDMLVYLFIETAVHHLQGGYSCDGEFLATLAGTTEYVGSTADSKWCLVLNLAPQVVAATLDAIAESGPRWRYPIVAARDPESPAGRVRQRLLADLDD